MKRKMIRLCLILFIFFLAVCSKKLVQVKSEYVNNESVAKSEKNMVVEYDYPASYMIEAENYIAYQDGMQCAAFSSAYLMRHFGEQADGMEIFEDFPNRSPDGGVFPEGIVNYLKGRGYQAEFKQDGTVEELKQLVSKGTPVIVFIHTEEPDKTVHSTHYIPMVGYDEEYLYFAESIPDLANCREGHAAYNRKIEIGKFKRLWLNIDGIWDYPYFLIDKNL